MMMQARHQLINIKEFKILGASAVGVAAIKSLQIVEDERVNNPNINGTAGGRMKKRLRTAMDAINTLVYKAEASGNPAFLRVKNRELLKQIEKLKTEDVLIKREVEEMRDMIEDLKKISELKDQLMEAEEDRKRARESQRIVQ